MRQVGVAALVVGVLLFGSGCTNEDDTRSGPTLVTQPSERSPSGDDAEVRAVVRYDDERQCVYLDMDLPPTVESEGSEVTIPQPPQLKLPVWPNGYVAELRQGKVRILNEDGKVVAVEGQLFDTNGGYYPLPADGEACGVAPSTGAAAVLGEVPTR